MIRRSRGDMRIPIFNAKWILECLNLSLYFALSHVSYHFYSLFER